MKKILVSLFLLLTLFIFGIALIPVLLPMDIVAKEVKTIVKDKTGRDINFSNIALSFWPNIGVDLQDVTFSNPAWAKEKYMFSLSKLQVALALKPLLKKHVEVKKFIFTDPSIDMEVSSKGEKSWIFSTIDKENDIVKNVESNNNSQGNNLSIAKDFKFKFSEFNIKKGKLVFFDHKNNKLEKLNNINVSISLPNLKSALNLKGNINYKGQNTTLELFIKNPINFIKGRTSPGSINLKSKYISFKGAGSMAIQGELLNGDVETRINSLPKLVSWLGNSNVNKLPFKKLSFSSQLRASKTDIILKEASLSIDEIKAQGDVNIGFAGKVDIFARLSLGQLNLDRFINTSVDSKNSNSSKRKSSKQSNWDKTPIDFSSLNNLNLDLLLKTKGFSLKGINVGKSDIAILLTDSKLNFKSSEAKLFGGKFSSDIVINARNKDPLLDFNFNVNNVQAKPILKTFMGFKKLNGAASGNISLHSQGNNQETIVSNLSGKGKILFKNGYFSGIDLLNIAKLAQSRNSNMTIGAGKTKFVAMGGDFKIKKAVLNNKNLRMKSSILQATGKGKIDLFRKYINYRVTPIISTSSNINDASSMVVPIEIKGYFSNIKIKPDFKAIISKIIANPVESAKSLKEVKANMKEQIKALKKNPLKILNGLFGGGFFGSSNKQPAQ